VAEEAALGDTAGGVIVADAPFRNGVVFLDTTLEAQSKFCTLCASVDDLRA